MTNITEFPKPKHLTSNIQLEIETTLLEDGSFWYRMKEIIGSKAGEWNEWVLLEKSIREDEQLVADNLSKLWED